MRGRVSCLEKNKDKKGGWKEEDILEERVEKGLCPVCEEKRGG
jgi:hypothetical protein